MLTKEKYTVYSCEITAWKDSFAHSCDVTHPIKSRGFVIMSLH